MNFPSPPILSLICLKSEFLVRSNPRDLAHYPTLSFSQLVRFYFQKRKKKARRHRMTLYDIAKVMLRTAINSLPSSTSNLIFLYGVKFNLSRFWACWPLGLVILKMIQCARKLIVYMRQKVVFVVYNNLLTCKVGALKLFTQTLVIFHFLLLV